jgi:hypothetical protein
MLKSAQTSGFTLRTHDECYQLLSSVNSLKTYLVANGSQQQRTRKFMTLRHTSTPVRAVVVERDGSLTASSSKREPKYDVVALSNLCVDIVLHIDEVSFDVSFAKRCAKHKSACVLLHGRRVSPTLMSL